jgi:uncharacterized protein (UPF0335 family)
LLIAPSAAFGLNGRAGAKVHGAMTSLDRNARVARFPITSDLARPAMADDASAHPDVLNQAAQGQLKSIIERIERLEVEKSEIAEQIKEVFAEAKGNGFDVKILRKVVRIRKQDKAKRMEEDAILDLYLSAIGEI